MPTQPLDVSQFKLPDLSQNLDKFKLNTNSQQVQPQSGRMFGQGGAIAGGAVGGAIQNIAGNGLLGSAITNTAQTYQNAPQDFYNQFTGPQSSQSSNPLVRVASNASGGMSSILNTIFAPFGGAAKALTDAVSQGIESNPAILNSPVTQKIAQFVNGAQGEISKMNPDAQRILGNAITTAMLAVSGGEKTVNVEPQGGYDGGLGDFNPKMGVGQNLDKSIGTTEGILRGTKNTAQSVESGTKSVLQGAKNAPGNVISAAGDYLNPLPENVKNVLTKGDPTILEPKLNTLLQQAKDAKSITGNPTPLEITGKNQLGGALKDIKTKLDDLGQQKESITNAIDKISSTPQPAPSVLGRGTYGFDESARLSNLKGMVSDFSKNMKTAVSKLGLKVMPDGTIDTQPGTISKIPAGSADIKTLQQVNQIITDLKANPSFKNIDSAIDATQDILYKRNATVGAEPINKELQGLIKQQIGSMNSNLKGFASNYTEGVGGDYAKVNADYAKTNDLYSQLNKKLGNNMNKAGSVMKSIFSPTDSGTKDLITQLEKETGRPIFEDATLSKFVMDVVDDPRAKSLLDKLSSKNWFGALKDYVGNKIGEPISQARRILKSR